MIAFYGTYTLEKTCKSSHTGGLNPIFGAPSLGGSSLFHTALTRTCELSAHIHIREFLLLTPPTHFSHKPNPRSRCQWMKMKAGFSINGIQLGFSSVSEGGNILLLLYLFKFE